MVGASLETHKVTLAGYLAKAHKRIQDREESYDKLEKQLNEVKKVTAPKVSAKKRKLTSVLKQLKNSMTEVIEAEKMMQYMHRTKSEEELAVEKKIFKLESKLNLYIKKQEERKKRFDLLEKKVKAKVPKELVRPKLPAPKPVSDDMLPAVKKVEKDILFEKPKVEKIDTQKHILSMIKPVIERERKYEIPAKRAKELDMKILGLDKKPVVKKNKQIIPVKKVATKKVEVKIVDIKEPIIEKIQPVEKPKAIEPEVKVSAERAKELERKVLGLEKKWDREDMQEKFNSMVKLLASAKKDKRVPKKKILELEKRIKEVKEKLKGL